MPSEVYENWPVRLCTRYSFNQSTGRGIKTHLVTVLVLSGNYVSDAFKKNKKWLRKFFVSVRW